jgi:hypothetical protein
VQGHRRAEIPSYCERSLNTVGSTAMTPDAYLMDASERLTVLIEDQKRLLFLIRQTRGHSETSQLEQTATANESRSEEEGGTVT